MQHHAGALPTAAEHPTPHSAEAPTTCCGGRATLDPTAEPLPAPCCPGLAPIPIRPCCICTNMACARVRQGGGQAGWRVDGCGRSGHRRYGAGDGSSTHGSTAAHKQHSRRLCQCVAHTRPHQLLLRERMHALVGRQFPWLELLQLGRGQVQGLAIQLGLVGEDLMAQEVALVR